MEVNKIYCGDTLEIIKKFPDESIDCIVTSPPYWGLRDFGVEGQIGLESTLEEYIEKILRITAELKRVLKKTGVMFWNHGDCYGANELRRDIISGALGEKRQKKTPVYKRPSIIPQKCMAMQNYRLILQMIDEQGWILRNIIIWYKPNHMPSSVKDRFTNAYEPVFMLVKNKKYWFDLDAVRVSQKLERAGDKRGKRVYDNPNGIKELGWSKEYIPYPLGKNPGDVWEISTQPLPEAHFATFPERLVEPMIKAGCPQWICKKCGKARERIVEKRLIVCKKFEDKGKAYFNVAGGSKEMPAIPRARTGLEGYNEYHTLGWTDCGCNAGWRPGIVLDPFIGAGTVAVVAKKLGRNFIGIELNPEYIKMAEKRIEKECGGLL